MGLRGMGAGLLESAVSLVRTGGVTSRGQEWSVVRGIGMPVKWVRVGSHPHGASW